MKNKYFNRGVPKLWPLHKILMIMKLIIVIMTTCLMQVSAAGFAQKVTYAKQGASLNEIFKEIRKQTGYNVFYSVKKIDDHKKLNVNFNNTDLKEVLEICVTGQSLDYTIDNKNILIKPKEISFVETVKDKVLDYFRDVFLAGKIVDDKGNPLPGATITVKGNKLTTTTNKNGEYSIQVQSTDILIVSYIGYVTKEVKVADAKTDVPFVITLSLSLNKLDEVSVVSNGYQDLPKERATGSFEVITAKQLEHSTDPNLLKRLEGITTSLDFNNYKVPTNSANSQASQSPLDNLTIRGRNTLEVFTSGDNLSGQPLVVIDGIASPYPIEQINPNDVETVTILKDAAAASIWGSRAANGVIVVKTKKGNFKQPLTISFNSNVNITDKMDLFYKKQMSSADVIEVETFKFNASPPNLPAIVVTRPTYPVSPVVEILDAWKTKHTLGETEAKAQLEALKGNDIRNDFNKYMLRNAVTQSYSLSLSGGTGQMKQRLSAGYDNELNNTIKSGANRASLNYNIGIRPLKNLDLQASIAYSQQNNSEQSGLMAIAGFTDGGFYPYSRLADDQGNPASLIRLYRPGFVDALNTKYGNKILSMDYKPLEDINEGYNKSKTQNLNLGLNANYKLNEVLSATLGYNYNYGWSESADLVRENSFYMRNLVNRFTNPTTFVRSIPLGGYYSPRVGKSNNHTLRGQINADKTWAEKFDLMVIAGADVNENYRYSRSDHYLGYDENTLTAKNGLDLADRITTLFRDADVGLTSAKIPLAAATFSDFKTRSVSFYSNSAFTYLKKYTLSASVRKDQSSEFGEGTNKRGTPFYSVGASWNINDEPFYKWSWLPYLKLRATFGYNGNVNPSAVATPIISHLLPNSLTENSLNYAQTLDVTNNQLRPERTGMLNLGLDWSVKGGRLSGSLEYYNKRTYDLLAPHPVDPSTGFNAPTINNGDLKGQGIDLTLSSLNIKSGRFQWSSNFLYSYNTVIVTKLYSDLPLNAGNLVSDLYTYSEGYALSRLFALKWGGLDPKTGDPRGYLNGQLVTITADGAGSDAFNKMIEEPISSVRYFGSRVPTSYGSFRNTFRYGNFSVSANMMYKLGYWFRRPNIDVLDYGLLFSGGRMREGAEYSQRWQKPGDELITNVPSMVYPNTASRDFMYTLSEINVLKADHIRLQEINLSYTFSNSKGFIRNPRIYANVNNLGIIWRANKLGLDPDINDYPQPRSYSFGFSANF